MIIVHPQGQRVHPMRSLCVLSLMLSCLGCTSTLQATLPPGDRPKNDFIVWTGKHATDIRSGTVLWEIQTKEPWQGVVSQAAGPNVFVETQQRELQRMRLSDGKVVWVVPAFEPDEYKVNDYSDYPTITVADQVVLHAAQKRIKAHDLATGRLIWSKSLEPGGFREVLLSKDQFFLVGIPALYDLHSGKTVWISDENVEAASFLPNGDIMASLEDGIACLARRDGRVLWRTRMTKAPGCTLFAGPYLVAGSKADDDNPWASVWDGASGRQLWFSSGRHPVAAAVSEDGGTLYLGRWDHRKKEEAVDLLALDIPTWSTRWEHAGELDGMALLASGSRLFVAEYVPVSYNTGFYCLSARDGSPLWKGQVEGIEVAHTIYSHSAEIQLRGSWVVLIDGQSAGSFVEAFQIDDGKSVSKWRFLPPR